MKTSDDQAIRKISQAIAIIGAGSAGLYTAIALAKKNIPSLLIDKAVIHGIKFVVRRLLQMYYDISTGWLLTFYFQTSL